MTNAEAKQAFLNQIPVVDKNPKNRDEIVYKCISLVGFILVKNKPVMICDLQDGKTNSITRTLPQTLEKYEGDL